MYQLQASSPLTSKANQACLAMTDASLIDSREYCINEIIVLNIQFWFFVFFFWGGEGGNALEASENESLCFGLVYQSYNLP